MDAQVLAARDAVFSDAESASWLLVGSDRTGKLSLRSKGTGGLADAASGFTDSEVLFAWVRLNRSDGGGDSQRVKFVLLVWLGEGCGAMAKARLTEHRALLSTALAGTHVTLCLTERAGLVTLEADVDAALRRAGGADYDAGNAAAGVQAGQTSSIKSSSKAFFQAKDAQTEIKEVSFTKHIGKGLSVCDLGNRVMTASATEAKRNTVGYAHGAGGPSASVAAPVPVPMLSAVTQPFGAKPAAAHLPLSDDREVYADGTEDEDDIDGPR